MLSPEIYTGAKAALGKLYDSVSDNWYTAGVMTQSVFSWVREHEVASIPLRLGGLLALYHSMHNAEQQYEVISSIEFVAGAVAFALGQYPEQVLDGYRQRTENPHYPT